MSSSPASSGSMIDRMVLGRYRVLRHLADGGMGAIYLARSEGTAGFMRPVVIKCVLPSRLGDPDLLPMFIREARIMANLRHPGIVSIIDFAEEEGMHFMVMEYVHGFHLGRWHKFTKKQHEKFPVEIAIHIVLHTLRALDYAHKLRGPDGKSLGIIHRDVTPSNILISSEGHIKLADFGIARTSQEHTDVGSRAIKGKFPYLAPELLQGGDPSPSSDLYSAGLVLHELLVGKNEFRGDEMSSTISKVLSHAPTPVDKVRDVPRGLADVIAKSLAKLPESRFETAADFASALAAVRTTTEDQCAEQIADMVARDFNNPEMARLFKLPQLNSLEADWATPAGDRVVPDPSVGAMERAPAADLEATAATDRALVSSDGSSRPDAATEILTPTTGSARARISVPTPEPERAPAPAPASRSSMPWILAAVGLVAAAAVAIVALLVTRKSEPAGPAPVIVVSDRLDRHRADPAAAAPDAAATAALPPDAAATAAHAPPPDNPTHKRPRPGLSQAQRLGLAFGKQRSKLTACFDRYAASVSGTPSLSLRIHVAVDGSVTSAELIPTTLGSTPLGSCLLSVARSTHFGAQDKAVTFRVPLTAHVGGR